MAISVSLDNINSGYQTSKINQNFQNIQTALEQAVSRIPSLPNQMETDFDMNGNDILNVGSLSVTDLTVNGSPILEESFSKGDKGWTPVIANVPDGDGVVQQIVDYVGGQGVAPTDTLNKYIGSSGLVDNPGDATNIRGPQGTSGAGTGDLLANNNLSDVDNYVLSFDNIKQPATDSYTGVVELATSAEAITGTATNIVVTPAGLKAHVDAAVAAALATLDPLPTGMVAPFLANAVDGWVNLNGGTVGNASSNATLRANTDTQNLFVLIWTVTANSDLPIYNSNGSAGSRGASAAADWAANKAISVPNINPGANFIRGKASGRGLGNSQASEVGTHNHTGTTSSDGSHSHVGNTEFSGAHGHSGSYAQAEGAANGGAGINPGDTFRASSGDLIQNYFPTMPVIVAFAGEHFHNLQIAAAGTHQHTFTTNNNSGTDNRPANVAMNYFIKL